VVKLEKGEQVANIANFDFFQLLSKISKFSKKISIFDKLAIICPPLIKGQEAYVQNEFGVAGNSNLEYPQTTFTGVLLKPLL